MPKDKTIKKVLVIGSGPIVIGQAAEFDYSGTQACLTLKSEDCDVILINNNPATIMTDDHIADKVYFEPLTVANIEKIIIAEKPDGILMSVSGQTGLNLAFDLETAGIFKKYNLKVLGTSIETIKKGEDRDKFRNLMQTIGEPIPESAIINNLDDARIFKEDVGLPIIIRPAYTLGGSGGGIAETPETYEKYVKSGLRASPINQCLIEKSIAGWKEIEFEVIRDHKGNAVIICHMENIDPVGVHTGDSIVVSPIQTLAPSDIEKLKSASKKIVHELGIVGACNVQLAFDPDTKNYIVIEVNPRVSRSSALASKATGYPIAKIATKLSLGYTLDELPYERVGQTLASYEPEMDYVIVKFPCWPFDKFNQADRKLGTQMKATGEIIAIDQSIAAGLQKAVRSMELKTDGLSLTELQPIATKTLFNMIVETDDRRFFAILELLRRDVSVETLHEFTKIDHFFLKEMATLIQYEQEMQKAKLADITEATLLAWKQAGFTDAWIAKEIGCTATVLAAKRTAFNIYPYYETVHAYAAKRDDKAVYYYTVWKQGEKQKSIQTEKEKILVIGSGPIRIGQGVEFDYCSVQGVQALQKFGYETVLINNNPATVSTDYEVADKLYIEPITAEDVLHLMAYEGIDKAIVQFGGQTAINLVEALEAAGITMLGSSMATIDTLEDRDLFYQYLQKIDVPHIPGESATSATDLKAKAAAMGYPILMRPSYVIGGKGMQIVRSEVELEQYITQFLTNTSYPILIDAYYPGKEVEVDAVTDGENILIPAIFEHIEKAGVHSGDSMAVTPPVSLSDALKSQIITYTEKIAKGIDFKGVFNIQFVIYDDVLYVLEVNPRASRTVPVVSKVTGMNVIELATVLLVGKKQLTNEMKILPENDFYTVKAPVFSTAKLPGVDPKLVPEMKSTGELIAIAKDYKDSLTKAFLWNEHLEKTFAREKKDIYLPKEVASLKDLAASFIAAGLTPHYYDANDDITAKLKTESAYAIYHTTASAEVRERAETYNLIVLTAEETVRALAQMKQKEMDIHAIEDLHLAYEKEVVLQ